MTAISVTLIRGTHAEFSIDDFEALKIIRLNDQGIDCIDNLEVFSQIEELYLRNNKIQRIENLDFLSRLTVLDLTDNQISIDSLISSIGLLPQNLLTLNLTGNPCALDDVAIAALQKSLPSVNIIVTDSLNDDENDEEEDTDDNGGDDEENVDDDLPLNADEVLQSLVERKCRLQSVATLNISNTAEVLNLEFDLAIQIEAEKQKEREKKKIQVGESYSLTLQKRVDELRKGSAADGTAMNDFKSRLAETVRLAKEEMIKSRPEIANRKV